MSRAPSQRDDAASEAAPGTGQSEKMKPAESRRTKHFVAGAAIGIGSAALVAALLYARNRSKT